MHDTNHESRISVAWHLGERKTSKRHVRLMKTDHQEKHDQRMKLDHQGRKLDQSNQVEAMDTVQG